MSETSYLGRRVLGAVVEFIGLLIFVYLILYGAEYRDKTAVLSQFSSAANALSISGMNQNAFVQFFYFLMNTFTGSWGNDTSIPGMSGYTVIAMISYTLPVTSFYLAISLLVSVPIVILLGIQYGSKPHTATSAPVGTYITLGLVLPVIFVAALLRFLFFNTSVPISGTYANAPNVSFPTHVPFLDGLINGNMQIAGSALYHLLLPFLIMVFFASTLLLRVYRGGILKSRRERYLTAATSMGIPRWLRTSKYLLNKGTSEVLRQVTVILATLFSFDIIIEAVFSYQGIGWALYHSFLTESYYGIVYIFFIFGLSIIVGKFIASSIREWIDPEATGGA